MKACPIVTDFGISSEDLRRLARLVEENGLSELRYEEGDLRITLRTASYRPAAPPAAPAALSPLLSGPEAEWAAQETLTDLLLDTPALGAEDAGLARVEAPVMGVFYRSPAPGEPPFIEIGDAVEAGQPIGMIEAMKVFSEVLAESAGRVRDIPAKNGALVQPGDVLVLLEEGE